MHIIDIQQDEKALALYANFEAICYLPSNTVRIDALIAAFLTEDPDFFASGDLGWLRGNCFDEQDEEELTDDEMCFRLMVVMLRDLFIQSQFIDQNEAFLSMLDRFNVPKLMNEDYRGDTINAVLTALLESIEVSVTIQPKDQNDAVAYTVHLDQEKVDKAEWAAIWQNIEPAGPYLH
jgi:hypothetical protein